MEKSPVLSLKSKIESLISRYEALKSRTTVMEKELSECRKQIKTKDETIKKLTIQIDSLQLTEAFRGSSGGDPEAGRKVRALIREIDRCITLLNER